MKSRKLASPVVEQRTVTLDRRAVGDGESRAFTGHAAVFNQRTAIGNPLRWGFYEEVAASAFAKTLREADVVFLADHDPAKPLARMSAGTLSLSTDGTGLAVDAPDLVATTYANDLIANVRAGNVNGMSFGFETIKDDWQTETVETSDGQTAEVDVRYLLEVRLIEVSTTAFPAYVGTDAGMRSLVAAAYGSRATRHGIARPLPSLEACAAAYGELRAGAKLSTDTLATLQQVLDLISAADEAVDDAQPILAALMGVPNPDEPEPDAEPDADDTEKKSAAAAPGTADSGDLSRLAVTHSSPIKRRMALIAAREGLSI